MANKRIRGPDTYLDFFLYGPAHEALIHIPTPSDLARHGQQPALDGSTHASARPQRTSAAARRRRQRAAARRRGGLSAAISGEFPVPVVL